jgi:hypothetical protein
VKHYADLSIGGEIQHQQKTYSSPSAWSSFVKNRIDNGWTSITYQGVKLSQWRNITGNTKRQFTTTKKKHGKSNAATGLVGVSKHGEKYQARATIDGTNHYIGLFKTKEEAGIAYDRFVVDKSNKEVTYVLSYPNTTDEQQHPYHVGQKIEVYYPEPGTTQRWFEATIKTYLDDGMIIHWAVHDSLYLVKNSDVKSLIRLVGENKEMNELYAVGEEVEEEEEPPANAKSQSSILKTLGFKTVVVKKRHPQRFFSKSERQTPHFVAATAGKPERGKKQELAKRWHGMTKSQKAPYYALSQEDGVRCWWLIG